MEELPTTQKAFILLDMLRTEGLLTFEEQVKVKEELLTILKIK